MTQRAKRSRRGDLRGVAGSCGGWLGGAARCGFNGDWGAVTLWAVLGRMRPMLTNPVRPLPMTLCTPSIPSPTVATRGLGVAQRLGALGEIAAACGSVRKPANPCQSGPIAPVKAAIALCRHYRALPSTPSSGACRPRSSTGPSPCSTHAGGGSAASH